jgi:hypothetical protein
MLYVVSFEVLIDNKFKSGMNRFGLVWLFAHRNRVGLRSLLFLEKVDGHMGAWGGRAAPSNTPNATCCPLQYERSARRGLHTAGTKETARYPPLEREEVEAKLGDCI